MTPLAQSNHAVQRLRRLAQSRNRRRDERAFVVEGPKLLADALAAGADIQAVYIDAVERTESDLQLAERCALSGAVVFELRPGVLARVCDAVTPQPIAAVLTMVDGPITALERIDPHAGLLAVVCVEVQDPGNAGAVLRSAGASGAEAVIFTAGSVDIYNPKSVRASAGALFKVPAVVADIKAEDALDHLGRLSVRRVATTPHGGCDYADMDLTGRTALVLGNEGHGLTPGLTSRLETHITIPMAGGAESLNVAMTAAILCFEAARQRRLHPSGGRIDASRDGP